MLRVRKAIPMPSEGSICLRPLSLGDLIGPCTPDAASPVLPPGASNKNPARLSTERGLCQGPDMQRGLPVSDTRKVKRSYLDQKMRYPKYNLPRDYLNAVLNHNSEEMFHSLLS